MVHNILSAQPSRTVNMHDIIPTWRTSHAYACNPVCKSINVVRLTTRQWCCATAQVGRQPVCTACDASRMFKCIADSKNTHTLSVASLRPVKGPSKIHNGSRDFSGNKVCPFKPCHPAMQAWWMNGVKSQTCDARTAPCAEHLHPPVAQEGGTIATTPGQIAL